MLENHVVVPNTILWIEDEEEWIDLGERFFNRSTEIQRAFGKIGVYKSGIVDQVSDLEAIAELEKIIASLGSGPMLVNVQTAQIARSVLERYVPGAIISDTGFPLNGAKVVQWLQSHGFDSYPLIGYSATPVARLYPDIRDFFVSTNARYFEKSSNIGPRELIPSIVLSQTYVKLHYAQR